MRKKKASIIVKSIFLAILFGIAIYYSSNEKSTFDPGTSLKFEDRNVDDSHNSSSRTPFFIPESQHRSNDIAQENHSYGSPFVSGNSGTLFNFRIETGTDEYETGYSEMPVTEERLTQNSTPEYYGGNLYSTNLPVSLGVGPVKSKKESKNSFGTTIASAKNWYWETLEILEIPELPMSPGPPGSVPLDGGTILIIIAGLCISIYKLRLKPSAV